jgi:hypothetical protein
MAEVLQFGQRRKEPVEIEPDLKEFIDRVIVPILVKEYMEIVEAENVLAHECPDATNSDSSTGTPSLREVRP